MFWLSLWHQGDKESGGCNQNYRFYRTNPILNPDFSVFSMWSDIGRLVFAFKHNSAPDLANEVQWSSGFQACPLPLDLSPSKIMCLWMFPRNRSGERRREGLVCFEGLVLVGGGWRGWGLGAVEKGWHGRCQICIRISVSFQEGIAWNKMSPNWVSYQEQTGHFSFCGLMAVELLRSEPEAGGLYAKCCVIVQFAVVCLWNNVS